MIDVGGTDVRTTKTRGPFSSWTTGAKNSGFAGTPAPLQSFPTTPTIVRQYDVESGYRSNATRLPTGSSLAKYFCASASLMSRTGGASRVSASVNDRPRLTGMSSTPWYVGEISRWRAPDAEGFAWTTGDGKVTRPAQLGHRQTRDRRCALHSRNGLQSFQRARVQRIALFLRLELPGWERRRDREQALGPETRVHRLHEPTSSGRAARRRPSAPPQSRAPRPRVRDSSDATAGCAPRPPSLRTSAGHAPPAHRRPGRSRTAVRSPPTTPSANSSTLVLTPMLPTGSMPSGCIAASSRVPAQPSAIPRHAA